MSSYDPQQETTSPAAAGVTAMQQVLKDNNAFLIVDRHGNIGGQNDGLFINDTRMLSYLSLSLNELRPTLLSSSIDSQNLFLTSHLTNPQWQDPHSGEPIPAGSLYIERRYLLWHNRVYWRLNLANFGQQSLCTKVSIHYDADFKDMFEIRGSKRQRRGETLSPSIKENSIQLRYRGLDSLLRRTNIAFSQKPEVLSHHHAEFTVTLNTQEHWQLFCEISPHNRLPSETHFIKASVNAQRSMNRRLCRGAQIECDRNLFQRWLDHAKADLALLTTELDTGPYPYAGIPWFSTPFGRDAIITALQTLWLDPQLTRGVLNYLAQHQANDTSTFNDAQPGKIMHETRLGEMTATQELPFGRYYGGVDTTPLFVILAGAYYQRTDDLDFIRSIWPELQAAGQWLLGRLAENPWHLLDYQRGEDSGLANQGWKDSEDSVSHADGRLAKGPIALVEVQGYAYRALHDLSLFARLFKLPQQAQCWQEHSEQLKEAVERLFWLEQRQFYALALDGDGKPCAVDSSNVGHLLYVGLPPVKHARAVIERLLSAPLRSGWGIRTLSSEAARFNPMSYHNGSIWPHDVAICCAGMAQYGEKTGAKKLLHDLFGAALYFDLRLPELYCGFSRSDGETPITYPVACQPQSWASGSVFMMLQACLGITIDAKAHLISVKKPTLPDNLQQLRLRQLNVGTSQCDLLFRRIDNQVIALISEQKGHPIKLSVDY